MAEADQILDPAHDDTSLEIAGMGKEDPADKKDEIKVSDDGNIVEAKGNKYVRQEALHQERQKNKELSETLKQIEPLMPEFEKFLKTKDNRKAADVDRAERRLSDNADPDEADYLNEVATALGFYDEEQKPDLRRAQAHLNITRREADRSADKRIAPVAESTRKGRADSNRERIRNAKFLDGRPVADQKYIDAAIESLGDEHLADDNTANMVQIIAAGLQALDDRKNGTKRPAGRREPMHLEGDSGRFDGDNGEMSALDRAAARARGKSPEQWSKAMKQANPSRSAGELEEV